MCSENKQYIFKKLLYLREKLVISPMSPSETSHFPSIQVYSLSISFVSQPRGLRAFRILALMTLSEM